MNWARGVLPKFLVSCLAAILAAAAAFGVLIHYDPWHSGLLNLVSLGILMVLALLSAIKVNFSWGEIGRFIKREKLAFIAAVFCLAFFAVGAASINQSWHLSKTSGQAITYDEVSLLPNGYYYLENGKYFLNPEHPPLVKLISAIPFYFLHVKQPEPPLPKSILLQPYAQFYWGKTFLYQSGNNTEAMILSARMTVLFVNAVLIFLLFLTIAYLWSRRAGLITVILITTSQFLISQASLSTLDFMSGILSVFALAWFASWLAAYVHKKPTRMKFILAAVCLGLALVAKFSTALLPPMEIIIGLIYLLLNWSSLKARRWKFVGGLIALCVLSMVVVMAIYAPLVRNMTSGDLASQLNLSYDTARFPRTGLSLLKDSAKLSVFGRAFAEYANGVLLVNNRIYQGAGGVYFRGHFYGAQGAGPSYFPVLYLAKLQITYHVLTLLAIAGGAWLVVKEKWSGVKKRLVANPLVMVVLLYCLTFGLIATLSTLQIGLRHVTAVISGFMLLSAIGIDYLIKNSNWSRPLLTLLAAVSVILLVGSAARSYPYYLSYYNAFAGGTNNGYKVAVDSNYDWGQDLKRLAKWQQDNNVKDLHFDLFIDPFIPISYYLGDEAQSYSITQDPPLPAGSYLAVSANQYEINTHEGIPASKKYSQYDKDLVARVGTTIFIYKIPAH